MWMRGKSFSLALCDSVECEYPYIPVLKIYTNEQRNITITIKCINIFVWKEVNGISLSACHWTFQSKKATISCQWQHNPFISPSVVGMKHSENFPQRTHSIGPTVCRTDKEQREKKNKKMCKAQNEIFSVWLPQWWRADSRRQYDLIFSGFFYSENFHLT